MTDVVIRVAVKKIGMQGGEVAERKAMKRKEAAKKMENTAFIAG